MHTYRRCCLLLQMLGALICNTLYKKKEWSYAAVATDLAEGDGTCHIHNVEILGLGHLHYSDRGWPSKIWGGQQNQMEIDLDQGQNQDTKGSVRLCMYACMYVWLDRVPSSYPGSDTSQLHSQHVYWTCQLGCEQGRRHRFWTYPSGGQGPVVVG